MRLGMSVDARAHSSAARVKVERETGFDLPGTKAPVEFVYRVAASDRTGGDYRQEFGRPGNSRSVQPREAPLTSLLCRRRMNRP